MEKLVKLTLSPFNPNFEIVDNLVMRVNVPYSDQSVTMQFNPNVQDYKEQADQPGVQVRQVTVTTSTDQTQTLSFDFKENNIHDVTIENAKYTIKLMSIRKEEGFFCFEFFVTTA